MTSLANADILELDQNQVGKTVSLNTALAALDMMLGGTLKIDYSAPSVTLTNGAIVTTISSSTPTSPYTIPYSSPDEPLGTKTALRFFKMVVTGTLAADWTAQFPANKQKFFAVVNGTSGGHDVIVKVSGGAGVTVAPGSGAFCFLNGVDVEDVLAISGGPSGFVSSVTAGTGISVTGTSTNPVVNALPATIHSVASGVSDTLSLLSTPATQIIWRSLTSGAKSQTIPAAASWGGYDIDIAFIGGVDPLTITPASGTIGGQASITLNNPGQTNLSLRGDSANTDWIIR